jgi:hypothetical protein
VRVLHLTTFQARVEDLRFMTGHRQLNAIKESILIKVPTVGTSGLQVPVHLFT